jgi:hypothetical protein
VPAVRPAERVADELGVRPAVLRGVVLRVVVLRERVVWLIARGETGLAPSTHS